MERAIRIDATNVIAKPIANRMKFFFPRISPYSRIPTLMNSMQHCGELTQLSDMHYTDPTPVHLHDNVPHRVPITPGPVVIMGNATTNDNESLATNQAVSAIAHI